jgi:hypothetical protein
MAASSALVLSGCASVTPYEMTFSKPGANSPNSSAGLCDDAFLDPGSSDKVMKCLQARGYSWEVRGYSIRHQSGLAGHLSFPAAAIAVGLTAIKDASDIVPIMGLAGGSYLAHAGSYARPDQAQVYELAAATYRCLVAGASDWKKDSTTELDNANTVLNGFVKTVTLPNGSTSSPSFNNDQAIINRVGTANIWYGRTIGANGLLLLRQSNAVETAARKAIGERLPSAQSVAASVRFGSDIRMPAQAPTAAEVASDPYADFNAAESKFYALLKAHQDNPRTIATDCRFNPLSVPPLNAPSEVVLDSKKGGFVLKDGVAPYSYLSLPDKVKVTIKPLSANAAYIEIDATGYGGTNPWTLTMIDASPAGDSRAIQVK